MALSTCSARRRQAACGRVVYAASSSAYGDTEVLPKVESMKPSPKSPYALQKLVGEYYAGVFAGVYGLETVSLRYFNVYGPRQDPSSPYSGVLSLFMKAVLERKSPTIFGDGEQSRDFTYVEDVAALNLKAARAANVAGRVYNAGNGGRITLEPGVGTASAHRRRRHSRELRCGRAPAMCATRRPTPLPPSVIWATIPNSVSKQGCASRWTGTATRAEAAQTPSPGPLGSELHQCPARFRVLVRRRTSFGFNNMKILW